MGKGAEPRTHAAGHSGPVGGLPRITIYLSATGEVLAGHKPYRQHANDKAEVVWLQQINEHNAKISAQGHAGQEVL